MIALRYLLLGIASIALAYFLIDPVPWLFWSLVATFVTLFFWSLLAMLRITK